MGFVSQDSAVFSLSTFGRAGVQVFFVISGFVIPLALQASRYKVRDFGRFLLKRLVRLEPPYIAAICISLAIAAYHTWVDGDRFPYSLPQLLVHLGYLNVFFRYQWVNPIFWTLGVELQYYLAVGLAFPILLGRNVFWLAVAPMCLVLALRSTQQLYIFQHLPLFLLGIAAFHYRQGIVDRQFFAVAMVAPAFYALVFTGWFAALASVATAITIATVSVSKAPLAGLGAISYSLYLIHGPVGATVGNFVRGRVPGTSPIVVVLVSLAGCLIGAWGLYRLVELPSRRLSKRLRYRATSGVVEAPSGFASP